MSTDWIGKAATSATCSPCLHLRGSPRLPKLQPVTTKQSTRLPIHFSVVNLPWTLPANCLESPYKCDPVASQLAEINANIKAPDNIQKTSCEPLTKFSGRPSLLSSQGQPFSRECWFSQLPRGLLAHLCLSHSAVSHRYMEIASQTKAIIMLTNIWLVIIENIVQFSGLWRSQSVMSRITGMSQVAIWNKASCAVFVKAVVLPRAIWASIEENHTKRRPCLSPYHEAKDFSLSVQDLGRADKANSGGELDIVPLFTRSTGV